MTHTTTGAPAPRASTRLRRASSPAARGERDAHAPLTLSAAARSSLFRSVDALHEAVETTDAAAQYSFAHVAALRAAAAVITARTVPGGPRRRQRNAWILLAEAAPEFGEWAAFFAAGASTRAAADAGSTRAVSPDDARALVLAVDRFLAVVEESLGIVPHLSVLLTSPETGGIRAGVA